MFSLLKSIVAGLLGAALGLGATWFALERTRAFGAVEYGAWTSHPRAASSEADPYTRALIARNGEAPLSQAEGIVFVAERDSDGAPLDPRCDYVFASPTPPARFWSLTTLTPEGRPIANPAGRNAIVSYEVTRALDGDFTVIASARARSGNWLPIAPDRPFIFMLRLYDTAGSSAAGFGAEQMPRLRRGACA